MPVYNKSMICYPIDTLVQAGINDILIVTGEEYAGDFARLLSDGSDFGCKFTFKVQKGSGGIASALILAEDFANGENIAVILGDNIFEGNFKKYVKNFKTGAHIFSKNVERKLSTSKNA